MALQTVNLGPNPFGTVNNAPVPWTGAVLLDAALVAAGATGYMALFGPDGTVFRMTVASQADGTGDGPDLNAALEVNPTAFTLEETGGAAIVVPGPNTPGLTFQDQTEPYTWNINDVGSSTRIDNLVDWHNALGSGDVILTIDDGAAPLLALADIVIPAGRQLVGTGSLIRVGASGDVYNTDATVLDGADPPNAGALAPTRIYVTGVLQLRISVTTGGDIEAEWSAGGALENHQLHVQTSLDESSVVSYGSGDIDGSPSNNRRLIVGADDDPEGLLDDIRALAGGDLVIWFLTEPEPTGRIQASIRSGVPTVSARVRTAAPQRVRASMASGVPVVSVRVRQITPQRVRASVRSGVPVVSVRVRTNAPQRVRATISSGVPVVTARVRPAAPQRVRAVIRSGVPTVSARVRTVPPGMRRVRASISSGVPEVRARVQVKSPTPARSRADIRSGVPEVRVRVRVTPPPAAPGPPAMLVVEERDQTAVLLTWDAPLDDGGKAITGYEIQIGSGAWQGTGTSATTHRLTGLSPGTGYTVRVRAVNSVGTGSASAALTFITVAATAPGRPRFLAAEAISGTVVEIRWEPPLETGGTPVTRYEVCVIFPDGRAEPFEPTADAATRWRIRGLARGFRYGFRVRAVNAAGSGPGSEFVHVAPDDPAVLVVPPGRRIPLLDTARQSLIARLQDIDCRIRVWWQPWDGAWYGSVEVPTNTPIAGGRRLAVNAGLLDGAVSPLDGNIVCRALDSSDDRLEPQRDAWAAPTHGLFWEPRP